MGLGYPLLDGQGLGYLRVAQPSGQLPKYLELTSGEPLLRARGGPWKTGLAKRWIRPGGDLRVHQPVPAV